MHDLEAERIAAGESTLDEEKRDKLQAIWREIRERYGIPDNTGPLYKQFGSVVRKIVKLALPLLPGLRHAEPVLDEPAAVPARSQKPAPAKTGARKLASDKTGVRKRVAAA